MKAKKLLKSISALICVATLGTAALTGCGGDPVCEHAYTWTVHEGDESNCTKAGKKTGVCGICGDIKEEAIPLDPTAHDYSGEWDITAPTEEAKGKAVKVCANAPENHEHDLEVPLPEVTLSGKGYTSAEFITVPTTAKGGEIKLTLAHEAGAITFNAPLAARKIGSVEDAVVLASSLGANVRKSEGTYRESEKDGAVTSNFNVYYGDDYTSVKESGNDTETWYSRDKDGNMFAMSKEGNKKPLVVADPDEENLLGFHYQSGVDTSSFYGAEQGLKKIYKMAQSAREQNTCVNYQESWKKVNDFEEAVTAQFSFSLFENPYFCRYEVNFETFADGTLKTLEVKTEIIRSYMFATDEDGNFLFYKEGDGYYNKDGAWIAQRAGDVIFGPDYPSDKDTGAPLYEYDENGNVRYEQQDKDGNRIYSVKDAAGNTVYKKVLGGHYKTVTKPDGTKEEIYIIDYEDLDYVPELFDVYLTDEYGMELVNSKGEKIKKIMAQGGRLTDYYSDEHPQVSHRSAVFNQTQKKASDVVPENPYDSEVLYIKSFDMVSAEYSGNTYELGEDIKLPSNTVVNLSIGNIQPAETAGLDYDPVENIYVVDEAGSLVPLKADFNNGSKYEIFASYITGTQKVIINSRYSGKVEFVFETKAKKCSQHVFITFDKRKPSSLSARASVYNVSDGIADYIEQSVSADSPVTVVTGQTLKFWAAASQAEAGYVSTDIKPLVIGDTADGVKFEQTETGSNAIWNLVATKAGTYTIKMPYFDGTAVDEAVYASFKLIVEERPDTVEMLSGKTFTGSVLMSAGENANPLSKTLTAAFSAAVDGADGVKQGEVTITVSGNTSVYTYKIDKNGVLTTEYKSGVSPDDKSYDFMFSVNDAADLVISHSTGMGKDTEDIVLKVKEG